MGEIEVTTMRKKIKFFVCYAHNNHLIVDDFLNRLEDVLGPSKAHEYVLWRDLNIAVGEDWDKEIKKSMNACDLGLLLLSWSFLKSNYISEVELPMFVNEKSKPCVPVVIQELDFELHDLKGLEKKQLFMLKGKRFTEPRSYGKCRGRRRDEFVLELFRAIEHKLRSMDI